MKTKDWILLIVPILSNGLLIYILQLTISRKMERLDKRNKLRDDVFLTFWGKLQKLNDVFIETNMNTQKKPETLGAGLEEINDSVLDIIQFYDRSLFDLEIISLEYNDWINSWNQFVSTLKQYNNSQLTESDQLKLGNELQNFKDKTHDLIKVTREKY